MENFDNLPPDFNAEEIVVKTKCKKARNALIFAIISLVSQILGPVIAVLFAAIGLIVSGSSGWGAFGTFLIAVAIITGFFCLIAIAFSIVAIVLGFKARNNPNLANKGDATPAIVIAFVSLGLLVLTWAPMWFSWL